MSVQYSKAFTLKISAFLFVSYRFYLLICLVSTLSSCSQSTRYSNKQYHFSLKAPSGWSVKENTAGAAVILLSPQQGSLDVFQENVNVVVQDLKMRPMALQEFSLTAINQLKAMYNNIEILKTDSIWLSGRNGTRLEYIVRAEIHLHIIQVWTIKDKKAYMITFSADVDRYPQYATIADQVINSFSLQ